MKTLLKLPLWKKNTIVSLFAVTVLYNGCSDVKFQADEEAILSILNSTAAVFINNNDKFTNNTDVTLSIFARSADEMMVTNDRNTENVWEPYSETKTWSLSSTNSQSNVYVKFRSRGVETEDFVTDSIIHDNIAPVVVNTGSPATWTNKTIADLEFTGNDNLSGVNKFYCSADLNEEFQACKNISKSKVNIYLGGLTQGDQYYYVKAEDQAGNLSTATRARWNIDTTPPSVRFVGSLPSLVNKSGSPFHFIGSDAESGISQYNCQVNNKGWSSCNSPYVSSAATDGNYQLEVRAMDQAGNVSTAVKHNWEVHLAAPIINFTSPLPAALSRLTNTQIGFEGKDKSFTMTEFQCRLNNATVFNCTSPTSLTNLKHGEQNFYVKGKDRFGDWSREFNYKFIVDTQVSRPEWGATPGLFTNNSNSQFDIIAKEGDTKNYHCKLNGGAWTNCPGGSSPLFSGLSEGPQTLQARLEDQVGNFSDSIYYNWVFDQTEPTLVVSGPQGRSKESNSYFHIQTSDNITKKENLRLECDFNGQGFKPCEEHTTFNSLPEGKHSLVVRSTDEAQNTTLTPIRFWFIDKSPAVINVEKQPEAIIYEGENANLLFEIDNDGFPIRSVTCKLNGYKLGCNPGAPISIDGLKPQKYNYTIEVIDDLGFYVQKDVLFEVKAVGDCSLSEENVCLVLRDNFERDNLFDHDFGWEAFYHDTGDRVSGLEIAIHNNAPTTDGSKFLNFTGRAGASVHSLYLMTKPFNLSNYSKITIEFDYLLANLEDWSWAGKTGYEFIKVDVCTLGSFECGISDNTSDARSKLNDSKKWFNVYTDEAKPNINKHLTGLNHSKDDFVRITGNQVTVELKDLNTNDFSKIMIRLNALMDEGLVSQTNDPDAVLVDNITIKAYK